MSAARYCDSASMAALPRGFHSTWQKSYANNTQYTTHAFSNVQNIYLVLSHAYLFCMNNDLKGGIDSYGEGNLKYKAF